MWCIVLLVLCIASGWSTAGLFARYVSRSDVEAAARVSAFGVSIRGDEDTLTIGPSGSSTTAAYALTVDASQAEVALRCVVCVRLTDRLTGNAAALQDGVSLTMCDDPTPVGLTKSATEVGMYTSDEIEIAAGETKVLTFEIATDGQDAITQTQYLSMGIVTDLSQVD